MDESTLDYLITFASSLLGRLTVKMVNLPSKSKNKQNLIDCISAIQIAVSKTRVFINANGYEANAELSELWTIAFSKAKTAKVDNDIPDYLFQKAKFWSEPQRWMSEPSAMELVPKLIKIDEDSQMLLTKFKK